MALGSELVTNGGFVGSANGWSLDGCTYSNNKIIVDDFAPDNTILLRQDSIGLQDDKYYLVTVTLTGTAGRLWIRLGSNLPNSATKYQCNRTKTVEAIIYQPAGGDDLIELFADNGIFEGVSIDTVSVREVDLDDLLLSGNLITNGDFNGNANGWDLTNTTWAYGDHNIVHTPAGVNKSNPALYPFNILDDEAQYIFQADILGTPAIVGSFYDSVEFEIGDGFGVQPGNKNGATVIGTNLRAVVQALFGTLTIPYFRFFPNGNFDGTMTNVSVKKILGLNIGLSLQTIFMVGANSDGDVQTINAGKADDGDPIYYELETQELEFSTRSHIKSVNDKIQLTTENASDSKFQVKEDDDDYKDVRIDLTKRVAKSEAVKLKGNYLTGKWFGNSILSSPILEAIHMETITDEGVSNG